MSTARKVPAKGTTTVVPEGVKQPEDHKPKAEPAEKPTVEVVDGGRTVTHKGVTVLVPDEALDDFELLADLREMQETMDASVLPSLLKRLVGVDGYRAVMNALRNPDTGRVAAGDGAEYVQAIFEALAPNS